MTLCVVTSELGVWSLRLKLPPNVLPLTCSCNYTIGVAASLQVGGKWDDDNANECNVIKGQLDSFLMKVDISWHLCWLNVTYSSVNVRGLIGCVSAGHVLWKQTGVRCTHDFSDYVASDTRPVAGLLENLPTLSRFILEEWECWSAPLL